MSSKYTITEPHPTVEAGHYTHSGRGGAGNTFKASSGASAATRAVKAPRSGKKFYSGIGGAGNAHHGNERAPMSFDEEFVRAKVRDSAEAGHVGIGGAGNVFRRGSDSSESGSERRSSHESSSTGFWGRLSSSSFARH